MKTGKPFATLQAFFAVFFESRTLLLSSFLLIILPELLWVVFVNLRLPALKHPDIMKTFNSVRTVVNSDLLMIYTFIYATQYRKSLQLAIRKPDPLLYAALLAVNTVLVFGMNAVGTAPVMVFIQLALSLIIMVLHIFASILACTACDDSRTTGQACASALAFLKTRFWKCLGLNVGYSLLFSMPIVTFAIVVSFPLKMFGTPRFSTFLASFLALVYPFIQAVIPTYYMMTEVEPATKYDLDHPENSIS